MRLRPAVTALLLGACGVVVALPLVAFASVGWFSRYASDDYCTAGIVLERGLLGAQHYWYTTWSGRFAFFGLVSAVELFGDWTVRVMPALALAAGAAMGAWALWPLAVVGGWRHGRLVAVVLAELVVFAIFASVPNLGQSLYWETGTLTYALPMLLLVVFGGWLMRVLACHTAVGPVSLLGAAVLACFAAGLSETNLAVQAAALGLALVAVVVVARRRDAASLVVAGLVGTVVAGVILAAAPGNGERVTRSDYPGAQLANLVLAARASLNLTIAFSRRFEAEFRPVFVATFVLPFALGLGVSRGPEAMACGLRRRVLTGLGVLLGAAALVWTSFFPSYWVLGFDPPARIELVAQCFIVSAVAALGFLAGRVVGPMVRIEPARLGVASVVAILTLLAPLSVAWTEVRQVSDAAHYAALWDQNDATLRQAHQSGTSDTVVVPAQPQWWGWDWVGPRTDDFPNACVARYYGLVAVRSAPASASP